MKTPIKAKVKQMFTKSFVRQGAPSTYQSDKGNQFTVDFTKVSIRMSEVIQLFLTADHPQTKTNGRKKTEDIIKPFFLFAVPR